MIGFVLVTFVAIGIVVFASVSRPPATKKDKLRAANRGRL